MSFQGDVRGIGLAELLQGLARGRKEGVLALSSRGGSRSTLGLAGGKLFLLPDSDEDAEYWRDRVRDAWAADPAFRVDYLRMSEIARAQRMENVYRLLDGEGIHFRFDPGPFSLGGETPAGEQGSEQTSVHCDGISVESFLLEYARVADELQRKEGATHVPCEVVPYLIDPGLRESNARFLHEIDGRSTLLEVCDRLGWAIRVGQISLWAELERGAVRLAEPDEMLRLALHELAHKNFTRAATRLEAWSRDATPGPLAPERAQALANEWIAGRLPTALRTMSSRAIRALLRRIDHGLANPSAAVVHWEEAARKERRDRIARLHWLACQFREGQGDRPDVRELLDLAREFRESGSPARAAPALVMAAHRQPKSLSAQLEVGMGLVSVGRVAEGSPWVLEAVRDLLARDSADRALSPLRELFEADPTNREVRDLLAVARRSSTSVRKLRKNALILVSLVAVGGVGALVKVHSDRRRESLIEEVRAAMEEPLRASALLDEYFGDDPGLEIVKLRDEIVTRRRDLEFGRRNAWSDLYRAAQTECSKGDPLVALQKIVDLPPPPDLELVQEIWPSTDLLYADIVDHMLEQLDALGAPVEGSVEQMRLEDEKERSVQSLERVAGEMQPTESVELFRQHLARVHAAVAERRAMREDLLREQAERALNEQQNIFLQDARSHAAAGDFERALLRYEELLATDSDGRITRVLAKAVEEVRTNKKAVDRARELASSGKHEEAWKVLSTSLDKPELYFVPWHVESFPAGAVVTLDDGTTRTTPFDIETTFAHTSGMVFHSPGYDRLTMRVERPRDLFVYLSRTPERTWATEGRTDALPLAVGEDHLVADRRGTVARVGARGEVVWEQKTGSVAGFARCPVALPGRSGHVLAVTEDGRAWIIGIETGELEGPWDLRAAPVAGPYPVQDTVCVRLSTGELASFHTRLRPTIAAASQSMDHNALDERHRSGVEGGLAVLRRGSVLSDHLQSPWSDWVVQVAEEVYRVFRASDPQGGYTVHRKGEWSYLAWEAPHGKLAEGRLWISDATGLRAFAP